MAIDVSLKMKCLCIYLKGSAEIESQKLEKKDSFGVWDILDLNIKATSENTEILFMEVPMMM